MTVYNFSGIALNTAPNVGDVPQWDGTRWVPVPGGGGGAVTSVFGRVGAVVAVNGDYNSDQVTNNSGVAGATVSDALNTLAAAIPPPAPVTSVFGRIGAVVATLGDYTSSLVTNLSVVGGVTVTDALNNIVGAIGTLSWATTLAIGAASGGTSPVISNGDSLLFLGPADAQIFAQSVTGASQGQAIIIQAGSNTDVAGTSGGGGISLIAGDAAGTEGEGGPVEIHAGDSAGSDGGGGVDIQAGAANGTGVGGSVTIGAASGVSGCGDVTVTSGISSTLDIAGGIVNIFGGNGGGGELGAGGSIILQPGTSGTVSTAGAIRLNHAGGNAGIVIAQEAATHLGNQAIIITDAGLAFFNGTPAERPSVTGVTADPALESLLTALDSMGLITDDTT